MKTFSLYTHYKKILADTITPVSVYLKIRDKYPNSILLESSDYHTNDNSFSYICCNPIASIKVENDIITQSFPDGSSKRNSSKSIDVTEEIHKFVIFFLRQSKKFNQRLPKKSNQHKESESLTNDLESHRRSKDSFVERKAFLQRSELREHDHYLTNVKRK